jgi:hypothetical protein
MLAERKSTRIATPALHMEESDFKSVAYRAKIPQWRMRRPQKTRALTAFPQMRSERRNAWAGRKSVDHLPLERGKRYCFLWKGGWLSFEAAVDPQAKRAGLAEANPSWALPFQD